MTTTNIDAPSSIVGGVLSDGRRMKEFVYFSNFTIVSPTNKVENLHEDIVFDISCQLRRQNSKSIDSRYAIVSEIHSVDNIVPFYSTNYQSVRGVRRKDTYA